MKFEYDKRESKEFYEEVLFILYRYREIKRKPNKKAKSLIKDLTFYEVLGIIAIILEIISYIMYKNIMFIVFTGMVLFIFIFLLVLLINSKKHVELLMNIKGKITVEIEKNNIIYNDGTKKYEISWKEISNVIFNKYSITFLPNTLNSVIISIPIKEKDNIISLLKKYKKEELIIDRRKL